MTETTGRSLAEIKRTPIQVFDPTPILDTGKFEQLQRYATVMASAKLVPQHLQNSIGDCFMVCQQAVRWQMDPFAVAQKTHVVQGRLGYEAQLVAAVVNSRAPLKTRLNVEYDGEGDNLVCIVSATMEGEDEPRVKRSPKIKDIQVKNSPLWKVDPGQQLAYWTQRAWARLHCSDVLLGVYTADEIEGGMIDVTPTPATSVVGRPSMAAFETSAPTPQREGAADESPQPYELVDETGQVESRHATVDKWAKELAAATATTPHPKDPSKKTLSAKAVACLRNNMEAWVKLRDEVTNDEVVDAIDKRYSALAKHAEKPATAPAPEPAPEPEPEVAKAEPADDADVPFALPVDGNGKVLGAKYVAMMDTAVNACKTKEAIVAIALREKGNMAKILPGAKRSIQNQMMLTNWVRLGGKQEDFAAAIA